MTAVPARRRGTVAAGGEMLAEGTESQVRAIVRQTGGTAVRGQRLPDGRMRVHIAMPVEGARAMRWWQGRSWKFWTPVAAGGLAVLGGLLTAFVLVMQALIAGVAHLLTAALGALVVLGAVALLAKARGGGTWTGSGTWS